MASTVIDAIDSYYAYCSQRMTVLGRQASVNGVLVNQPMGGIVQARDWPQTPTQEGTLYLLNLNETPQGGTKNQQGYVYFMQWVWIVIGQDIQAGTQAANRGSRYRSDMQIRENLRLANLPGFCQKKTLSADSAGNITIADATSESPESGYEPLMWSSLKFMPRDDGAQTGLIYGAAAVELYAFVDAPSEAMDGAGEWI